MTLRHKYEDGEVTVRFIAAKAKVAPTKVTSVPRLELMAAVLGLRLTRKVSELLDIPFENCTLWTDSKDGIFWIQGQSRRYKTFIANQVSEIHQKCSPRQWRHVPVPPIWILQIMWLAGYWRRCWQESIAGLEDLSSCMSVKTIGLKENAYCVRSV